MGKNTAGVIKIGMDEQSVCDRLDTICIELLSWCSFKVEKYVYISYGQIP